MRTSPVPVTECTARLLLMLFISCFSEHKIRYLLRGNGGSEHAGFLEEVGRQ